MNCQFASVEWKTKLKIQREVVQGCNDLEKVETGSHARQIGLDIILDMEESLKEEIDRLEKILNKNSKNQ